jgi:hypothetical protein
MACCFHYGIFLPVAGRPELGAKRRRALGLSSRLHDRTSELRGWQNFSRQYVGFVTQSSSARSSRIGVLFGWVLALGACAADEAGSFSDRNDGPGEAVTSGDDRDESDPEAELTLARGISIDEVEINQGTRIPIGYGGDWVDGAGRLGFLIASRDSLLRIHYSVDPDWEPREIEARLTLGFPDGTSKVLSKRKTIESSSQPYSLDGLLWFGLVADAGETVTGTTYQIELWETVAGAGAKLEEGLHSNPADGPQLIGFEAVPMQIKVVLVPIEYNNKVPQLNETVTQQVINNLYEQNPATEILYEIHEVVPYTSNLNNLGALLPVMGQLRVAEDAEPNVYYHALVDVGAASLGGVLGISALAGPEKTDAASRVSATVLWSVNPAIGADTFTHEAGHAQGLFHVECPNGGAAGPDPAYPHANGRIGNWGFGIRRFLMYDPDDAFDYMSYCGPSWVSDWTWNKTYQRIRTLTSWDFEGAPASDELAKTLLIGAIYPDGTREWWTVPGAVAPEDISGQDRFEFEIDGQIVEGWAALDLLSDGATQWVKVELPAATEQIGSITHIRGDQARRLDKAAIASHVARR